MPFHLGRERGQCEALNQVSAKWARQKKKTTPNRIEVAVIICSVRNKILFFIRGVISRNDLEDFVSRNL